MPELEKANLYGTSHLGSAACCAGLFPTSARLAHVATNLTAHTDAHTKSRYYYYMCILLSCRADLIGSFFYILHGLFSNTFVLI